MTTPALLARVEDVEWLLAAGETWPGILRRLDVKPAALARSLRRAGRPDLARGLSIPRNNRPGTCTDCGASCARGSDRCWPCWTALPRETKCELWSHATGPRRRRYA